MGTKKNEDVREVVREAYGRIAEQGGGCGCGVGCCGPDVATPLSIGYSQADVEAAPEAASIGLGCGNPQLIASLKAGEDVLDLGAGGGFDCFLAAKQVGPSGRVIGVDMTPAMVTRARANAVQVGVRNVEFRLGEIEHLPIPDASVDVVLSNCVLNLSPEKPAVFREVFRVLRPGGRLACSDVVATAPLAREMAETIAAYTSCIGGAALVEDLHAWMEGAGFTDISIRVNEVSRAQIREWMPGSGAERFVASASIAAVKPARAAPG